MHANAPPPRKQKWYEKIGRSGYFIGALLFHLILFLLVATLVIWKAPVPPPTDEFHGVAVKVPPPPPAPPPSSSAAAANPQFEPQPEVVPVVTPMQTITTVNNNFTVDTTKVLDQALSHLSQEEPKGTGLALGMGSGSGAGSGAGLGFGSAQGTGLEGHFYDLKQTRDRRATNIKYKEYYADLTKFVTSGWNEALFSHDFKSKTALYANSIAISMRPSEEAPNAFQVGDVVKPAFWVVHYHGKVTAPETGDYQFVGFADNVLVVRIGKEVVLDAGWTLILPKQRDLHQELPATWLGKKTPPIQKELVKTEPNFRRNALKKGKIFHMNAAEPVEMDVLIGDDGGNCGFYLLIINTGHTYEKLPDGTPKVPFFQLSDGGPPSFSQGEARPPYSTTPEPWQTSGN